MSVLVKSREFTGRHMLMIMVSFFGVVIAVNTLMAVLAVKSWTGLVVPNSYVASQTFEKETARRTQAVNAGANIQFLQEGGFVTVTFKGKDGEALQPDTLILTVGHPVDPAIGKKITFRPEGNGAFKSDEALPPGTWVGEASATLKGYGDWVHPVRLLVKG